MSTRTGRTPRPSTHTRTANDVFKHHSRRRAGLAALAAVVLHGAAIAFFPAWQVDEPQDAVSETLETIVLMPEVNEPPPREPVPRPAAPVVPDVTVPDDIEVPTIEVVNDDTPELDEIPPPPDLGPIGPSAEFADYKHVVPSMVAPELVNRSEVQRALERNYPRALQRAGVEGTVMVWFWIDEDGIIQKHEIRVSSGSERLDEAAERVIDTMEFRPAVRHGEPVRVIVALPIVFEVH